MIRLLSRDKTEQQQRKQHGSFPDSISSTFSLSIRTLSMASVHKAVLLSKNVLGETTKTMGQVLEECGRGGFGVWILFVAAYTNARSVDSTKVFRLSQHIDRLCILPISLLISSYLHFDVIP